MECPKCHFEHPLQTSECMKCGLVFAKYTAGEQATAVAPAPAPVVAAEPPVSADQTVALRQAAKREFNLRLLAVPGALLLGWTAVKITTTLAEFLHMWAHEAGHAMVAWFCGYPSLPGAWATNLPERQRGFTLFLAACVAYGAYAAWKRKRWFWVAVTATIPVLLVLGATRTEFQSIGLVYFGGDSGAFVIGTVMMATFYARPESAMVKGQVRWGMLVLGAIAFMYGYATWAGGYEKIAGWLNDIDERGPSDLQMLTQMYGWGIGQMQARFLAVAHLCFAAMAAMYAAGLVQARSRIHQLPTDQDLAAVAANSAAAR